MVLGSLLVIEELGVVVLIGAGEQVYLLVGVLIVVAR